jgi:6-phosphogluconolactonase
MGVNPIVVVDELPALQQRLAKEFLSRSVDAIARRDRFIVALPGGSVAQTFFPTLAVLSVDWTRTDVFWIDERAVPPDHPDSNYGLAEKLLLQRAGVPSTRVHRMHGESIDLDEAARRASDELTLVAGRPPRIDVALVGVGEDGHVASLFADDIGDAAAPLPVIAIYDSPKPPPRRLTMTMGAITSAGLVIVAGFGPAKAHVIHEAMHDKTSSTPVGRLLRRAPASIVLVDGPFVRSVRLQPDSAQSA